MLRHLYSQPWLELSEIRTNINDVLSSIARIGTRMSKKATNESAYTAQVKTLVRKVHDATQFQDSIFEEASDYFAKQPALDEKLSDLQKKLEDAEFALSENSNTKATERLQKTVKERQKALKALETQLEDDRLTRLHKLKGVCQEVLNLAIGQTEDETNKKIAKFLGTLLLISHTENREAIYYNQKGKHLYQAVLALKLLNTLLDENLITNQYILERSVRHSDNNQNPIFVQDVQIPLLMTSIMLDVGTRHPDAQRILKGEKGKEDEFRALEPEARKQLLKIDYQQDLMYITYGLGKDKYIGNSKTERDAFNRNETQKLTFMRTLLKSAIHPEQGIGNLIKVPQIYSSVVMFTKRTLNYESIPKVFLLLKKGAEKGNYSESVVEALLKITGVFPQGFGITYIPKDSDGKDLDRYEYAIVNSLYPSNPHSPICRAATRNLTFNSFGNDNSISPDHNLYYPVARQKLEKFSENRLREILSKLWDNYTEHHQIDELIPRYWHPYQYFSLVKYQNLWNKKEVHQN